MASEVLVMTSRGIIALSQPQHVILSKPRVPKTWPSSQMLSVASPLNVAHSQHL